MVQISASVHVRTKVSLSGLCAMTAEVLQQRPLDVAYDIEMSLEPGGPHERLVAYVRAVSGESETRSGVWGEHSYAKPRGTAGGALRELLVPRAPPPAEPVDVEALDPPPPAPPGALEATDAPEPPDSEPEDEWEERVASLAPSAAHARLARVALETIRTLRLARLAGAGRGALRREETRAGARRLRAALAPLWAASGAAQQRPAAWLHGTLLAYLPRVLRPLYEELVEEVAHAAPRLAERMGAAPSGIGRALAEDAQIGPEAEGPWLVWVGSGQVHEDARWARALGARLHTRTAGARPPASGAPDAWCAAVAEATQSALDAALAEARAASRPAVVAGMGAGAALALGALGSGARGARALVLLAPPLLTAEGPRDALDDPLHEVEVPVLLVCGAESACGGREEAAAWGARGGGALRRVLVVRGADANLRAPRRLARRLALPACALSAAILEEVVRFAVEACDRTVIEEEGGDYSHLPVGPAAARDSGRMVSRGCGATPLPLAPPPPPLARTVPPAAPAPLAPADIMRLPIVFADDEPGGAGGGGTGGGGGSARGAFSRVIVAKRAGGAPAAPTLLLRCATPR